MSNKYNNAESLLAGAITGSSTEFVITTGEGGIFDSTNYPQEFTIEEYNESGVVIKRENVTVSSRTGDVFAIDTRASQSCVQDESISPKTRTQNALSFSAGARVYQTITEAEWNALGGGGAGINLHYPVAVENITPISQEISSSAGYTVPAGKVLYITFVRQSHVLKIDNISITEIHNTPSSDVYIDLAIPVIVGAGSTVTYSTSTAKMMTGFLVNESPDVNPVTTSGQYTVPVGKQYVMTHVYAGTTDSYINNGTGNKILTEDKLGQLETSISMNVIHQPIILDENWIMDSTSVGVSHTGYLIDKS